jgi:hypothetical protein
MDQAECKGLRGEGSGRRGAGSGNKIRRSGQKQPQVQAEGLSGQLRAGEGDVDHFFTRINKK